MKCPDQKIVDPPERGDCMIACIATVLDVPYDEKLDALRVMIDEIVSRRGDWMACLGGFAIGMGKRLKFDTVPEHVPRDGLLIAGGVSPRGCKAGHAVVIGGSSRTLLHDPHPSRLGLVGEPQDWMWFESIEGADA